MKKSKVDKKQLVQWWLQIYWAGIAVVMVSMVLQTVSVIGVKADDLPVPPDQQQKSNEIANRFVNNSATLKSEATNSTDQNASASTTSLTFQEYACKLITYADPVIWSLVGLTIIIAGIVYATSMGQSGGDLSIGLAKQMIVAAITGAILYLLGGFLLGSCGSTTGGWISDLINGR